MELPEPKKLLISAVKYNPAHLPSIIRLAEIYISNKEFLEATALLTDSENAGASDPKIFYLLSKIYFLQEQWLDAQVNIEKSLSRDATSVDSLELAIRVYEKLEDHYQCIKYLEKILEENPQPKDYFRLSKLLKSEEHFARSVFYLEESINLEPNNEIFLTTLLNAYKDSLKYPFLKLNKDGIREKGKRIIEQLTLIGLDETSLTECFSFLFEANLNEELIEMYQLLGPLSEKIFCNDNLFLLAQAYASIEQFEESISILRQIQDINQNEFYQLYLLRCFHFSSKDYKINKKKMNQLKQLYLDKKQSHIDHLLLKNDFFSAKKALHDLKRFESVFTDFF